MRTITVIKEQTLWDLAVQEYGNAEAAFQILADNDLAGLNDLPAGHELAEDCDFDIAYPIKPGVKLVIQDRIEGDNQTIAHQLENIIS